MTVENFAKLSGFELITMPRPDAIIDGAYVGDLLSWVMGRAGEGNLWITIMTNVNIVAVAMLREISAIILAEGVEIDADVIEAASLKGVNILRTPLQSYEAAIKVAEII
jgi:hypothetical protein